MTSLAPPSCQAVVKALEKLSDEKTKQLVFHLGVGTHTLENIETRYNVGSRNIHMVQAWLDSDTEASWKTLVMGLNDIGMKVIARDIARHYSPTQLSALRTGPLPPSQPADSSSQTLAPPPSREADVKLSSTDTAVIVTTSSVEDVKCAILELEEKFSDLISDTEDEICEKENRDKKFLNRFRNRLLVLPVTRKPIHIKFFLESEDDILAAKNTRKILAILCRYWNYRNYEILFHIITRFCEAPLKKSMMEYEEMITTFEADTTIDVYIIAISAGKKLSLALTDMVVKLDKTPSECTLQEVRKLKEEIAEASDLCSHSVYIASESVHCVVVVLKIPTSAIEWVVTAMTPEFMAAHHLTEVSVNEHHLTVKRDDPTIQGGVGTGKGDSTLFPPDSSPQSSHPQLPLKELQGEKPVLSLPPVFSIPLKHSMKPSLPSQPLPFLPSILPHPSLAPPSQSPQPSPPSSPVPSYSPLLRKHPHGRLAPTFPPSQQRSQSQVIQHVLPHVIHPHRTALSMISTARQSQHAPEPSLLDNLLRLRTVQTLRQESTTSIDSGLGDSVQSELNQGDAQRMRSKKDTSPPLLPNPPTVIKAKNPPLPLPQRTAEWLRGNLKKYKWFWGDMNRADSEAKMKAEGEIGNFAITINANVNLVMTVWKKSGICHSGILQDMGLYKFEAHTKLSQCEGKSLVNLLDNYLETGDDEVVPFGGTLHLGQNEGWTPPALRMSELQKTFIAFKSRRDAHRLSESASLQQPQAENPHKEESEKSSSARDNEFKPMQTTQK